MHKISNETLDHGCHIRHQITVIMKTSCWFLMFCFERGAGGAFFNRGVYRSESVGCAVAQFFGGDTASEIHFKKFATFLRNTWCVFLRIVFLEIMGDSGESITSSTRKRKRVKLKCLLPGCNGTFDDDYHTKHNKQFHAELIKSRKSIPFETVGARKQQFFFAVKQLDTQSEENSAASQVSV